MNWQNLISQTLLSLFNQLLFSGIFCIEDVFGKIIFLYRVGNISHALLMDNKWNREHSIFAFFYCLEQITIY